MREEMVAEIRDLVAEKTGTEVIARKVTKNNGAELTGLVIGLADGNPAPTIYINDFLDLLEEGEITMHEAVEKIAGAYSVHKDCTPGIGGLSLNRKFILERVECRLVNRELNRKMLVNMPHKLFLDLAVIYIVIVDRRGDSLMSFKIKNEMLRAYGISMEDLDAAAMENTKKRGFEALTMKGVLEKISGIPEEGVCDDPVGMHVLTNADGIDGACVMLYPEYFKELAERAGSDLYILPSSTHEVIAVPAVGYGVGGLHEMVREVNSTAVERKDFLSNSVYRYDRDKGDISLEVSPLKRFVSQKNFA